MAHIIILEKKQRRVRIELGWVTRHSGAHHTRQRYNSGVSQKKMKGEGGEFVAACCRPVKNRGEAMLLPGVNICVLL